MLLAFTVMTHIQPSSSPEYPHLNRLAVSFGVDLSSPAIGLHKHAFDPARNAECPAAAALSRAASLTFDQTNQHGPTMSDHAADRHLTMGYWGVRMHKLTLQRPDEGVYADVCKRVKQLQQRAGATICPDVVDVSDEEEEQDAHEQQHAALSYLSHPPCPPLHAIPRSISASPPRIFEGVTAYINGFTGSSTGSSPMIMSALHMQQVTTHLPSLPRIIAQAHANAYLQMLRLHGGLVTPLLRKRSVTHVVASNLCWSKLAAATAAGKGPVYVRPQWVLDSVAEGKRLKECDYAVVAAGAGQSSH